jgi:hypothetical protein
VGHRGKVIDGNGVLVLWGDIEKKKLVKNSSSTLGTDNENDNLSVTELKTHFFLLVISTECTKNHHITLPPL